MQAPFTKNKTTVENFINKTHDTEAFHYSNQKIDTSNKTQPINITLSKNDIIRLESQIDRATRLGLRTKNRSAIIRMGLRLLEQSSDDTYITLYRE